MGTRARGAIVTMIATAALAVSLVACSSETDPGSGGLQVSTAFYPLQWVTEQVGGDAVSVSSLTPPGVEPHDLELTPRQVAEVQEADLVVTLPGFQPSVDDAAGSRGDRAFDARRAADGARADDAPTSLENDPHVWLDPVQLAAVATALGDRLAELDPGHADDYRARAKRTAAQLAGIDDDFRAGLDDCRSTDLVTAHEAFGHLAHRYGLTQRGITGISPEAEPSPKRMAEIADFVTDHDVRTIYVEPLVSDDVARTVAGETGADVAVLDPIEGITDRSAGPDYPTVMAANLAALRTGQDCS